MANFQQPPLNPGFYPSGQQGYPYPQQNPGYPPPGGDYGQGYPPSYGNPPAPGFVPPGGGYGQGPPPPTGAPFGGPPPPAAGMYGTSAYGEDPMQDEIKGFGFSEKSIRNGFIRKVYSILMAQLTLTVATIALFMYHEPTREFARHNRSLFWVCFAVTIVLLICMACCTNVRRKAPMNFVFLGVFTAAESVLLGFASSTFDAEAVLMAAGITAFICLALTLFAFQTKYDFTGCHTVLFVAIIVLMLFGLIVGFVSLPGNKKLHLAYACLGALLFSFYLIYDTQMMLGGNHKYSISPEEYIFAALNLYLDVINIFLYILSIIGSSRD